MNFVRHDSFTTILEDIAMISLILVLFNPLFILSLFKIYKFKKKLISESGCRTRKTIEFLRNTLNNLKNTISG